MTPAEAARPFWWGTQYFRPPTPREAEWEEDFGKLKDFGLETIQARVFWRSYERTEGHYQWEELDRLMDLARRHGLRVIHQISLENGPQYIFDRHDGYRIDIRGQRIWPIASGSFYQGGWIPCFDHPVVMGRGLAFVRALVERYRNHPAMECWHAWNEPRSRPMGECTCGHSIASYRQWLEAKFHDIESLNEAYGKCWPDFGSIDAARDTSDYAEMYLWRQWAASRVRDRVERVVGAVRALDQRNAVVSHVGLNNMQQDPLFDISDDRLMADVADLYGSSFEVRYTPEPLMHSLPFLICDWMRHVCEGKYSIFEIYPSRGRFEPEVLAHQLQQWLWTPVSCAATAEFLWQFKKERVGGETNDAGLIELDGSENATSAEARMVFADFQRLRGQVATWQVPASRIALVYDLKSDLVSRIEQTAGREADYVGGYKLKWSCADTHLYKAHFQASYHLFWLNNIHVDVISSERLAEMADRYDVLYLPALAVVDAQRAEVLLKFVRRGGRLIVDAGFANRDDNTWLHRQRPALACGYREKEVVVDVGLRETLKHADGMELPIAARRTTFDPGEASVISRWADGGAAVVERTIGDGRILALGFYPGLSYLMTDLSPQWRRFTDWMLAWAGAAMGDSENAGAGADITVRELGASRDASDLAHGDEGRVVFAFRRWGVDSATSDDRWNQHRRGTDARALLDATHVRCAIGKGIAVAGG